MTTLTAEQKSYFAGIFDSGGIMAIYLYKGRPLPIVQVRRSERALLDVLAKTFGGTVSPYMMKSYPSFYWRARGAKAQAVVRAIRPYLRLRTKEANELLGWRPGLNGGQQGRVRRMGAWAGLEARA